MPAKNQVIAVSRRDRIATTHPVNQVIPIEGIIIGGDKIKRPPVILGQCVIRYVGAIIPDQDFIIRADHQEIGAAELRLWRTGKGDGLVSMRQGGIAMGIGIENIIRGPAT